MRPGRRTAGGNDADRSPIRRERDLSSRGRIRSQGRLAITKSLAAWFVRQPSCDRNRQKAEPRFFRLALWSNARRGARLTLSAERRHILQILSALLCASLVAGLVLRGD